MDAHKDRRAPGGAGFFFGPRPAEPITDQVNALIDAALVDETARQEPRGYLGGSRDVFAEIPSNTREWRTPPLWGVRDSAPYLHDGRAPDLATAIMLHGGEATVSVKRFSALGPEGQGLLLAFLNTLTAPDPDKDR